MSEPHRPARPTGWSKVAFRLPIQLYRARLGGLLGSRFVLIHHVGRKSGAPRQVVVEVIARDETTRAVIVASGFGPEADWYQNVLAHPDIEIELGWARLPAHAEPRSADEASDTMADYARQHPRAAKSLAGFMGYDVDGSLDSYRAMGSSLPMLRLLPRRP